MSADATTSNKAWGLGVWNELLPQAGVIQDEADANFELITDGFTKVGAVQRCSGPNAVRPQVPVPAQTITLPFHRW